MTPEQQLRVDQHRWHELVASRSVDFLDWVLDYAIKAHDGQVRKYTHEPYIYHPVEVAVMVGNVFPDIEVIAAAYLHDTVEDCGKTLDEIGKLFGYRVARLVDDLTDASKPEDGNRRTRKALDRQHTLNAHPEAQAVKVCDLLSNTASITAHDPSFSKVYMTEKAMLLQALEAQLTLPDWAMSFLDEANDKVRKFFA